MVCGVWSLGCGGAFGFVGRAQACLGGLSVRFLGRPLTRSHGSPHPAGSLILQELLERWVGSPVGQYSSLLLISLYLTVVSSQSGLSQLKPRTLAGICPLHHPSVQPNPDRSHIYSVDSFIQCFMARQWSHRSACSDGITCSVSVWSHPSVAS